MYFTNFNKNIKTLCIMSNPVKKIAVRMFFYFCLSFVFIFSISVSMSFFVNFYSKFMLRYMSVLTFLFFKALCCNFFCRNAFNSGITTDCSIFSIKLIWLNPKSARNLIVFWYDNPDWIIIVIAISSWTYIECLLFLNNLAWSTLCFLICGFVRPLMFLTPNLLLISLSIRS